MAKEYYINNRFSVNTELNLLKELETGKLHRLEPRLIILLTLLAENAGKLTSREMVIAKIWNDYGGAEDSLNQAISFLRKVLQDSKRDLIETVSKKGYILHATISSVIDVDIPSPKSVPSRFKYRATWAAAICTVLLGGYLLTVALNEKDNQSLPQSSSDINKGLDVNFSELNQSPEENSSNTIRTAAPDGTKYRLVAIGDKRPQLYVDDRLITGPEIEKYSKLMDQLLRRLWEKQKEDEK